LLVPLDFHIFFCGDFIDHLASDGVVIDRCVLGLNGDLILWLHVLPPGRPAVWLSLPVPPVFPTLTAPSILITTFVLLLVGVISWIFARRVTQPLELVRRRIAAGVEANVAQRSRSNYSSPVELLDIEDEYNKLIARLRTAERERELLLAGVSHDLRSPLGRIRLAAEMLPATPQTQDDVLIITNNVDHADRLIGSFLDFVRAGSLPMEETVDVAEVARSVVARFEREPTELRLEILPAGRMVRHRVNALMLDRLIFNLVDNAIKHGRVPVLVSLTQAESSLIIDVCDQGLGLPEVTDHNMLNAFARGDASRGVPGSGLGLSVVQQVVERLGGTLQFIRDSTGHHARVTLA
jgi:two-component system osmolarity sensor histidine kinase EnvZ